MVSFATRNLSLLLFWWIFICYFNFSNSLNILSSKKIVGNNRYYYLQLHKQHALTYSSLTQLRATSKNSYKGDRTNKKKSREENLSLIDESLVGSERESKDLLNTQPEQLEQQQELSQISLNDDRKKTGERQELMEVPVGGIKGYKVGSLYEKGFDIEDPLFNPILASLDNLPGEEGSPERLAAIQTLVEKRQAAITELKDPNRFDYLIEKVPSPPKSMGEEVFRYLTLSSTAYPKPSEVLGSLLLDATIAILVVGFTYSAQIMINMFMHWWLYDVELPGWLVEIIRD